MADAFRQHGRDESVFVIFEEHDADGELASFVQFTYGGPERGIIIEVSSGYAYTGGNTGDLVPDTGPGRRFASPDQEEALGALGFNTEKNPNYRATFHDTDPMCLAILCERAFTILDADPFFDLHLKTGNWSS